jgi:hypothetical protein
MGEHLVQGDRRDKTKIARAKRWGLRFIHGIGGTVLKIDLLISEAQCLPRPPVRAGKNLPFESERPFVKPRRFFDVIDREDDVIESVCESFWCHGIQDLR